MRIATAATTLADSEAAADAILDNLEDRLGATPHFLLLYCNGGHDLARVTTRCQRRWSHCKIQGGTSCRGLMTDEGIFLSDRPALAGWAALSVDGSIGVGHAPIGDTPFEAAMEAVGRALDSADRTGELPELIWLSAAPGLEEELLSGITEAVGPSVPVFGGSTADDHIEGKWRQAVGDQVSSNGVTISAFFTPSPIAYAFRNGYEPTDISWTVTKAKGRIVYELDGRPAAHVYAEALGGKLPDASIEEQRILLHSSFDPLGRRLGQVGGISYFLLSHPEAITPEGHLRTFSNLEQDDRVTLMQGSADSLKKRARRVAATALESADLSAERVSGALVVFCAGCMLAIEGQMSEVATSLRERLGEKPFLGIFTFGEQGCVYPGRNLHGNLMISTTLFSG